MSDDTPPLTTKTITEVKGDDLFTVRSTRIDYDINDPALWDALDFWVNAAKQQENLLAEFRENHNEAIAYLVDHGFAAQSDKYFRFPAGHNEAHFSLIWYAAEVANTSYLILHRKAGADAPFIHLDMRRSFNLGYLVAEWNFRRAYQASTRRGIKTRKAASDGGKVKASANLILLRAELTRMAELINSGLSVNSAATIVARETGKSPSGVRSTWYRAKK